MDSHCCLEKWQHYWGRVGINLILLFTGRERSSHDWILFHFSQIMHSWPVILLFLFVGLYLWELLYLGRRPAVHLSQGLPESSGMTRSSAFTRTRCSPSLFPRDSWLPSMRRLCTILCRFTLSRPSVTWSYSLLIPMMTKGSFWLCIVTSSITCSCWCLFFSTTSLNQDILYQRHTFCHARSES